ncbi:conserved membrane hypothetical protein [Sphingomonas sp. EC-HK361]|uniref:acyltransferase family protein n=1 Tax=Sphingomonas sp. EC-HK361 TaxID=2038397 RepID=UPI00125610C5|nr:acyltransferase family protein [Sphingomonas sp. EC-HK361]VVT22866.1 conserved membrane hypothetical protein [Sphingomonas sp. EC-HK361]
MPFAVSSPFAGPRPAPISARAGTYRADIDGLRALAVIAVVLFHARLGSAAGGFVGVDVFFVISGYLITKLIDHEILTGRFSIAHFYERRIRRLFPALFAMLAAAAIAAAILLMPDNFAKFGRNVAGAAGFVSNVFLWEQGSYFEAAEAKPLLHTWSLAIEEQFYLLFPPLLMLLRHRFRHHTVTVLGGIALASFVASVVALRAAQSAVFYLPQYRMWELLCGSLLALGAIPRIDNAYVREFAALAGLALILFAVTALAETTPFPGAAALLPCAGAMLVIHAGEGGKTVVGQILSSRPLVFIGLISYSVYLWHWPLIVFFSYYIIDEPSFAQSLLLLAASFVIGALSWRFIELPFRKPKDPAVHGRRRVFGLAAATAAVSAAAGGTIYFSGGFPGRFSPAVDTMENYARSQNPRADRCAATALQLAAGSPCTIGNPRRATLFLWGDSHAGALYGALRDIARTGPATVYGATPRCPPLLGVGTDADCIAGNQRRLDYVLTHPEITTVIIAARWSLYSRGRATRYGPAENNADLPVLQDAAGHRYPQFTAEARRGLRRGLYTLVARLLAADKHVVLIYPVPEMGYDIPSTIARLTAEGRHPASFGVSEAQYLHRQRYAIPLLDGLGRHPNLTRVYPEQALCPGNQCLGFADGTPLYFDSHHLSIPGSRRLEPLLAAALHRRS